MKNARWVVRNMLARSSRPGYPSRCVDKQTVLDWLLAIKQIGIKSVICLLSDEQLSHYSPELDDSGGLVSFYGRYGIFVHHIPVTDHKNPPLSTKELEQIKAAFDGAEKPVLIHCSAGIDRTGMAVDYLTTLIGDRLLATPGNC